MKLSEPVTLSRLPRNPQGPSNINFGTVWGWRSGAKRKRHEVCAAIEGNCVNVYEAQNGQVLFSHAVPPTTIFTGPPCSLRWKEDGIVHRTTCYVSLKDGIFLHVVSTKGSESAKPVSVELTASASPVVHLDLLKDNLHTSVLMLQQDGTVTVATTDLKYITSEKTSLREPDGMDIMTATVLPAHHAQKSVLRARADLLNNLTADAQVLVTVSDAPDASTLQKNVTYAAWTIRTSDPRRPTAKLDIRPLFQHSLSHIAPLLDAKSSDITSARFDGRATSLDITLSKGLLRFDLSAAVPRPLPVVRHILDDSDDTLALSASHLVAAYAQNLRIIDVNYSTLQSTAPRSLKRKKVPLVNQSQMHFISYFGGINRVLARDGQLLVALSLHDPNSRSLPVSTLANNIGRGVKNDSTITSTLSALEVAIGSTPDIQPLPAGWREDLQELVAKNEISKLEEIVIKSFKLESLTQTRVSSRTTLPGEVLDFVLERMFKVEDAAVDVHRASTLRLRFLSPPLVRTLCRMGLLRTWTLQRALRLKLQSKAVPIHPNAIIKAIFAADPSLQLAQVYAGALVTPDAEELACILQFLVQQAGNHSNEIQQQPALPTTELSGDMDIENRMATKVSEESELLPSELEACLVPIIERFGSLSVPAISSNLKAVLSKDEVYTLIGVLRLQLFQAGHTRSMSFDNIKADELPRVSLQSAVTILSACVDAFGPLDLINRSLEDDLVERFVPQLLSEISMVTQYIDESADLQGIIRETLRYAESQKTATSGRKAITNTSNQTRRRGEIVTLYAQRTEDEDINGLPGALPLSLRADDAIKTLRIRKGGGQVKERTQRELLMLQSRQKGPYTFERLVL